MLIGFFGENICRFFVELCVVVPFSNSNWSNFQSYVVIFVVWMGAGMNINAFHPDYVKTHMPEFQTKLRIESAQHANGVVNGAKSRIVRESVHGKNVDSITVFPKTKRRGTQ